MSIDYKALFDAHGVAYTTRQASEGSISIACPFCARTADPDPSQHLGINMETGAYNCWRNTRHRGSKPHRLLKVLIGLSYTDVDNLLGKRRASLASEFEALFGKGKDPFAVKAKTLPNKELTETGKKEFAEFSRITSELAVPHCNYLQQRGISVDTAQAFGLKAGIIGRWAGRVIFPVTAPDSARVATWTSRSIGAAEPRYLALSRKHGANLKHLLYRHDRIAAGGETLVVTEGPMDAVVLQQLAPKTAVTCVFGLSISDIQIALIRMADYSRVIFLFDSTAYGNAVSCAKAAGGIAIDYSTLFGKVGDPGDLTENDIPKLTEVNIK